MIRDLVRKVGPFDPAIGFTSEWVRRRPTPGTTLRCSAFTVDIATEPPAAQQPALGIALRGAPEVPRGSGWTWPAQLLDPAPSALPTISCPLVQPNGTTILWFINDASDMLQVAQPDTFYDLMHSTGTDSISSNHSKFQPRPQFPACSFPNRHLEHPEPGIVPTNQGSPDQGDIASMLYSTGLFPGIGDAISMLEGRSSR